MLIPRLCAGELCWRIGGVSILEDETSWPFGASIRKASRNILRQIVDSQSSILRNFHQFHCRSIYSLRKLVLYILRNK